MVSWPSLTFHFSEVRITDISLPFNVVFALSLQIAFAQALIAVAVVVVLWLLNVI